MWPQELTQGYALWPMRIGLKVEICLPVTEWREKRLLVERRSLALQPALQRLGRPSLSPSQRWVAMTTAQGKPFDDIG